MRSPATPDQPVSHSPPQPDFVQHRDISSYESYGSETLRLKNTLRNQTFASCQSDSCAVCKLPGGPRHESATQAVHALLRDRASAASPDKTFARVKQTLTHGKQTTAL